MSDSLWPHRQQPTRLPCPWDSPGKNTGVGCHCLLQCMKVKSESEVAQPCPTRSVPMDCSLPGSSVHGIFQARVLEWGAIASSGESAMPPQFSSHIPVIMIAAHWAGWFWFFKKNSFSSIKNISKLFNWCNMIPALKKFAHLLGIKDKLGNNAWHMKICTTRGMERRSHWEIKHEWKRHQRHGGNGLEQTVAIGKTGKWGCVCK